MAIQTLNTIKNWFKTSLKPSQQQFWDTWDSFRHKLEKISVKDISDIDELLDNKADKKALNDHLADINAHAPQVNTDWNSESGFSQLLNKPDFKTINGEPVLGDGNITIKEGGLQNLDQTLTNGNTSRTPINIEDVTAGVSSFMPPGFFRVKSITGETSLSSFSGLSVRSTSNSREIMLWENYLRYQSPSSKFFVLNFANPVNEDYTQTFQDKSGTIALLSDINQEESQNLNDILKNGNETSLNALFKKDEDTNTYQNTINSEEIEIKHSNTAPEGENRTVSLKSDLINFSNLNTGKTTALYAEGIEFGNVNAFSVLEINPGTTASYSNVLMPLITEEGQTKTLTATDDFKTINGESIIGKGNILVSEELAQDNFVRKIFVDYNNLPYPKFTKQDIIDFVLNLPEEERTLSNTDSKINIAIGTPANAEFPERIFEMYEIQNQGKGVITSITEANILLIMSGLDRVVELGDTLVGQQIGFISNDGEYKSTIGSGITEHYNTNTQSVINIENSQNVGPRMQINNTNKSITYDIDGINVLSNTPFNKYSIHLPNPATILADDINIHYPTQKTSGDYTLTTRDDFKTINGESIIGEGDLAVTADIPDGAIKIAGGLALDGTFRNLTDNLGNPTRLWINNTSITSVGSDNTLNNVAFGPNSMRSVSSGTNNTAFGAGTLLVNTSGSQNTAVGYSSLGNNTTGNSNTAFGWSSLLSNTEGRENTVLGNGAMFLNKSGNQNVALGSGSLSSNTSGSRNIAIGYAALNSNQSSSNLAIGTRSLVYTVNGNTNIAIGEESLQFNIDGSSNAAIGFHALQNNTSGSWNVALGVYAGKFTSTNTSNTISNNSIFLGSGTMPLQSGGSNEVVIGDFAIGSGNNSVTLGNTNITKTVLRGAVSAKSYKLDSLNTAPASSTAAGNLGEIRVTADYIYVCTAANTWVRSALSTW